MKNIKRRNITYEIQKNSWDKLKSDKKVIAFAQHIKYMKVDHKLKKIKRDKNSEGDE